MRFRRRLAGLVAAVLAGAVLAAAPAGAAATATLGTVTVGSATDAGDSNYINATRYVTGSSGGTVSSVSVHVGAVAAAPNNQYQVAVYADASGKPGALVASSSSGTLTANAWNTLPLTAALSANTAYWLAYNTNGTSASVNNLHYTSGGTSGYGTGGQANFCGWGRV